MKTTITLTYPRMGTLALSQMMNTFRCFSHHEVSQSMFIPDIRWEDTYEGKAEIAAKQRGMNYFLPVAYGDISLKKRMQATNPYLKNNQLECLVIVPGKLNEHVEKLQKIMPTYTLDHAKEYEEKLEHIAELAYKEMGVRPLYVCKDGDKFSEGQLLSIAKFTGAIYPNDMTKLDHLAWDTIQYLSDTNISLTKDRLYKNIDNALNYLQSPTGEP